MVCDELSEGSFARIRVEHVVEEVIDRDHEPATRGYVFWAAVAVIVAQAWMR